MCSAALVLWTATACGAARTEKHKPAPKPTAAPPAATQPMAAGQPPPGDEAWRDVLRGRFEQSHPSEPTPARSPATPPAPAAQPPPAPAAQPPPAPAAPQAEPSRPEPPPTAAEGGPSFEKTLMDMLREQGIITSEQYEQLWSLARQRFDSNQAQIDLIEGRLGRLRAPDVQVLGGKPTDLEFRSPNGKWSMGIKGRIQARYENKDSDAEAQTGQNFSVPRARLTFDGKAGAENIRYKLELDAPTNSNIGPDDQQKDVRVTDAWIDWAMVAYSAFRMGQYRFPFGREGSVNSGALALTSTSIAYQEFAPGREPGAMVHGRFADDRFDYYTAVSNGDGSGDANASGESRDGLRDGVRFVWNPLGKMRADGSAFQTVEEGGTRMALGGSYMINHDSVGKNTVAPGAETRTAGAEFQMFTGPLSLQAEHYDRTSELDGGANIDDSGHTEQVGCFLYRDLWELVARHSVIDFDTKTDETEKTLGLNFYRDEHRNQWTLEYTWLDDDGDAPDARVVRLQWQVMF